MTEKSDNDVRAIILAFSPQSLADLRHLVSIAAWIRSEQLKNEHVALMTVNPAAVDSRLPPVSVLNEGLNIRRAQKDLEAAVAMWESLTEELRLRRNGAEKLTPSWHIPEDFLP